MSSKTLCLNLNKPTVIVPWSGGIDSSATLVNLCASGEYNVLSLHIVLMNGEERWEQELEACEAMLPTLKGLGLVHHFYCTLDHRNFPTIPRDVCSVMSETGKLAMGLAYRGVKVDYYTIGTHLDEGHNAARFEKWFQPNFESQFYYGEAKLKVPEFKLFWLPTKGEEIKLLEDHGLFQHAFYCRRPTGLVPCGQCHTCLEVAAA
jgi:7-cyano-7-deazaguanine synthase in queuosine biosynthesis